MTGVVTALVLTYNERENIARTLHALRWAPSIVLLDSCSTDDTVDIGRSFPNVRIEARAFDTHAAQWNFGLKQITTEWVLALDADYELAADLAAEIQSLTPTDDISGYEAAFVYRIHGRALRASVYPGHVVLFRRDRASYYDDGHTQKLMCEGRIEKLHGILYHDDRKPLSRWIESQGRYSSIEARHLLEIESRKAKGENVQLTPQDRLRLKLFFAPWVMFLYLLFGRGLILDGWAGWYYVMQRTIAEALLSVRLLSEKKGLETERSAEKACPEQSRTG